MKNWNLELLIDKLLWLRSTGISGLHLPARPKGQWHAKLGFRMPAKVEVQEPEWEADDTDERAVKWNREQTEYLYRRLASVG